MHDAAWLLIDDHVVFIDDVKDVFGSVDGVLGGTSSTSSQVAIY